MPQTVKVTGKLVGKTEKAIQVEQPDLVRWIPKSVCTRISISPKKNVEAIVEKWFVDKEGLDYE